jgi:hypothetical protein
MKIRMIAVSRRARARFQEPCQFLVGEERLGLLGDLRRFDAVHRVRVLALALAGEPAEEHADVPEVVCRGYG